MGLFGKIFKGIGKIFKKVGKFIKKGFAKVGKFMNKFGILGQIGMMVMSYGIGSMAMAGLKALGSTFMSGLSSVGWTAGTAGAAAGTAAGGATVGTGVAVGTSATIGSGVATGTSATIGSGVAAGTSKAVAAVAQKAAAGPIAGMARVAHGVLEGAAKIASLPGKVVGTITDQVVGTVTDVAKAFGNSMKMATNIGLDPSGKLAEGAVRFDDIFSNAAARFKTGTESVAKAFGDVGDMYRGVRSGDYGTDYQKFIDPNSKTGVEEITRNLKYSTENRELAGQAESILVKRQEALETEAYKSDATKQAIIDHNAEQATSIQQSDQQLQKNAIDSHNQQVQDYLKTGDAGVFDATPPPTEVLDAAFQTKLQSSGSQSLLAGIKSKASGYFSAEKIEQAGAGALTSNIQSKFTPPESMEPTFYAMPALRSGTEGVVDYTESIAGIGAPVLTNFVEDRAGVADPNNDWSSFYNNASEQFGFGVRNFNQNRSFA